MKKLLPLICLATLASCTPSAHALARVHLTSQKGLTQTLTAKERLRPYEDEAYLQHQPHSKVVRVFEGSSDNKTIITTYYPSGHIFQLLECRNNQANGRYLEWGANGKPKVKSYVIGGSPEITSSDHSTWIFDKESEAFDGEGRRIALFNYSNGLLEGESYLFYPDGELRETLHYLNGLLHGENIRYDKGGVILEKVSYKHGERDGEATLYWDKKLLASQEKYLSGKLVFGLYFDRLGKLLARIKDGNGYKISWQEDLSYRSLEYQRGVEEGSVSEYDSRGSLTHSYHQRNGEKEGEEIFYYPSSTIPKLAIDWSKGEIHGMVRSWYANGQAESEREVRENKKQGLLTAKYRSGDLMLIEEYDQDLLVKGQYFEPGRSTPISTIFGGEGTATLYDENGLLSKKIEYLGGKPIE